MKITETILAQLTETDALLENVYQAIADEDPNFAEEMATYEKGVRELQQAVPDAVCFLQARRQELVSDIRFAHRAQVTRSPYYKLLLRNLYELH